MQEDCRVARQIRLTDAEAKALGLDTQVRQARLTPASGRIASGGMRIRSRRQGEDLSRILAVALQERFPDVFAPNTILGIHWAAKSCQLGVQWGGVVRTEANAAWTIIPVWGDDLRNEKGDFSQQNLNKVLRRIEEMLHAEFADHNATEPGQSGGQRRNTQ